MKAPALTDLKIRGGNVISSSRSGFSFPVQINSLLGEAQN
jgi:hypothetical protein